MRRTARPPLAEVTKCPSTGAGTSTMSANTERTPAAGSGASPAFCTNHRSQPAATVSPAAASHRADRRHGRCPRAASLLIDPTGVRARAVIVSSTACSPTDDPEQQSVPGSLGERAERSSRRGAGARRSGVAPWPLLLKRAAWVNCRTIPVGVDLFGCRRDPSLFAAHALASRTVTHTLPFAMSRPTSRALSAGDTIHSFDSGGAQPRPARLDLIQPRVRRAVPAPTGWFGY